MWVFFCFMCVLLGILPFSLEIAWNAALLFRSCLDSVCVVPWTPTYNLFPVAFVSVASWRMWTVLFSMWNLCVTEWLIHYSGMVRPFSHVVLFMVMRRGSWDSSRCECLLWYFSLAMEWKFCPFVGNNRHKVYNMHFLCQISICRKCSLEMDT